jgi:hypothetical protein
MSEKKIKYLQEIRSHVRNVQLFLQTFSDQLVRRGILHDNSKFYEPELTGFSDNIDNVPNLVYESDEYKKRWLEMKDVIDEHHRNNRHHPEHWPKGVDDMSLLDIIEMLVDWKASSMRYKDGSLKKSVEINCVKYNISPQLKQILLNTIRDHFPEDV